MPIKINNLHSWDLTYKEAVEVQRRLSSRVILKPLKKAIRFVGGADVSYSRKNQLLFGAVVIIDIEKMEVIEAVTEQGQAEFAYIPGLLSFREIPVLLRALKRIHWIPELFILDGQGIAHPQGLGLASHLGLLLDHSTVGCAKSRLVGEFRPFPKKRGSFSELYFHERKVGAVICTKDKTNPVFVSPGHRIDIPSSINVILGSCHGYRLPEPIRQAHALATSLRAKEAFKEKHTEE